MFVLDTSVAATWIFEDETDASTDALLKRLHIDGALAPDIWILEVSNLLLMAERRQRLAPDKKEEMAEFLMSLPLEVVPVSLAISLGKIMPLAQRERLTAYDAAYLYLAMQQGIAIATLDGDLRAAAARNGVAVLPA